MEKIPKADFAVIGGSSTFALQFPEELRLTGVKVIEDGLVFDTPFGTSPTFKLLEVGEDLKRDVITAKMHGWRAGVSRKEGSLQLFYVLKEAGVKKVIAEGGVGGINPLLRPRDLILPHDFIDFTLRRDAHLFNDYLVIMRNPICSQVHRTLLEAAQSRHEGRIFERGIYAVTEGPRFESPAEVSVLGHWGADVVGQSLAPEVYLAREIGACYAGIYMVVNYAEGVVTPWSHQELTDIFFEETEKIGSILVTALQNLDVSQDTCHCNTYRKPTLLKE